MSTSWEKATTEKGPMKKQQRFLKNYTSKRTFNTTYLGRLISCYQETQSIFRGRKATKI